jgi:ribosomal protein S12 methylthiotransferase
MTGFPGEGEMEFGELEAFVREAKFDHAGFFKFSPEDGAPASLMPERPSRMIAERRRRRLFSVQRRISRSGNRARTGGIFDILVEGPSEDAPEVCCGRGPFQAPQADGLVYFEGVQPPAGTMVRARIIRAGDYDLVAEALDLEDGPEEGRKDGRKDGREAGPKDGRQDGRKEGRKEGRKNCLDSRPADFSRKGDQTES